MAVDSSQELFSFGPFTISVECQADAVVMSALVENGSTDDDLLIFGAAFIRFLEILPPASTLPLEMMRIDESFGDFEIIDVARGALGSSTGYYVGWDGDFTGGLRDVIVDLTPFGENVDCVFTGTLNTFFLEPPEVALAPAVAGGEQ